MNEAHCRVTIDGRFVEVPRGATVLQAARQLGLDIPTLCYLEGLKPQTSCLVCTVKVIENGRARMMPSCGAPVSDGMVVESETAEVAHVRRRALELILSDHVGDCFAPCHYACPARINIPNVLRHIQVGQLSEAIATIKQSVAIPGTLSYVCPRPCEKGCRRHFLDEPVMICQLSRFVAEKDLTSGDPYSPPCQPDSGRAVAVVGAGPTGLSAAYYLRLAGHRVIIFDKSSRPGGRLRQLIGTQAGHVPDNVIDAEIALILRLGVEYRGETPLVTDQESGLTLTSLLRQFDTVLLAYGEQSQEFHRAVGLDCDNRGLVVNWATFQTSLPQVFAAGSAIRGRVSVARSCADGKSVAECINDFLRNGHIRSVTERFGVRMGRLEKEELDRLAQVVAPFGKGVSPSDGWDIETAREQAGRCLHCDCRALPVCRLRQYAERYGVDPNRYRAQRARLEIVAQPSGVIFEPGKCILCGICVELTESARTPLGLTFIGRGFDVRIGVPFNKSLEEALGDLAERCVAACPTGALSFREGKPRLTLPILAVRNLTVQTSQ